MGAKLSKRTRKILNAIVAAGHIQAYRLHAQSPAFNGPKGETNYGREPIEILWTNGDPTDDSGDDNVLELPNEHFLSTQDFDDAKIIEPNVIRLLNEKVDLALFTLTPLPIKV